MPSGGRESCERLIHRIYILLGSEIHIDMFDDQRIRRGMYDGRAIKIVISHHRFCRTYPVITDLFPL